MIEVRVSQMPYLVGLRYESVRGTRMKLTSREIPFRIVRPIIFFFAATVRECPTET
jgi:hypothetical protein